MSLKFFLTIFLIGTVCEIRQIHAVQGDATYYDIDGTTACGTWPGNYEYVAAIGPGYFSSPNPNNDKVCQQYATVRNLRNGLQVRVRIQDKCPSCGPYNIDLSRGAFQKLGEAFEVGIFRVEWNLE